MTLLTGNTSLDWLGAGLTDMVVTDLSQIPDVEVLSTRLHRILDRMKRADDKVLSADVVDALARDAGVDTVLLGSYITARERLYVEGVSLSRRPETYKKAMDIFRKATELYPDHAAARQNLAVMASNLEDDEEMILQLEELRRLGGTFPSSFSMLAGAYARKGSFERGYEVYQDFLRRFPENAASYADLGNYLVGWGRLNEASQVLDKATALGARPFSLFAGRFSIAVHRDRWDEAAEIARRAKTSPEPIARVVSGFSAGTLALYQGRSAEALGHYRQTLPDARPPFAAIVHIAASRLHIHRGDWPGALAAAEQARIAAAGFALEREALALLAIARAKMGQPAAARASATDLRKRAEASHDPALRRWADLVEGEMSLAEQAPRKAVDALKRAQAALQPRVSAGPPTQHVPIWYALARAQQAAGDRSAAAESFRKIVAGGVERDQFPIEFVRSL